MKIRKKRQWKTHNGYVETRSRWDSTQRIQLEMFCPCGKKEWANHSNVYSRKSIWTCKECNRSRLVLNKLWRGRLTPIAVIKDPDNPSKKCKYLFKCTCGGEIIRTAHNSLHSCGCLRRETAAINRSACKKRDSLSGARGLYGQYRHTAKRRGRDFTITFKQFVRLTSENCYYCGIKPFQIVYNWKKDSLDYVYNGLDRLNNTKGYTIRNVVPCCGICNSAKGARSKKDFLTWISKVVDNLNIGD